MCRGGLLNDVVRRWVSCLVDYRVPSLELKWHRMMLTKLWHVKPRHGWYWWRNPSDPYRWNCAWWSPPGAPAVSGFCVWLVIHVSYTVGQRGNTRNTDLYKFENSIPYVRRRWGPLLLMLCVLGSVVSRKSQLCIYRLRVYLDCRPGAVYASKNRNESGVDNFLIQSEFKFWGYKE